MGSFNVVCNLSGINIESGDKVLAIVCLSTKGREDSNTSTCYSTDIKIPAFLPLYGKYDGYGCIEFVKNDVPSVLFSSFLNNRLTNNQLQYSKKNSKKPHDATNWVKLISANSFTVNRLGFVYEEADYSGEELSIAFVHQEAFEEYSKIGYKKNTFLEAANNWFEWYVEVVKKTREWMGNDDALRKARAEMLISGWGTNLTTPGIGSDLYKGLEIPTLKGDQTWNMNSFQQFLHRDYRYVESSIFKEVYFEYLKFNIEECGLCDVSDMRWKEIRDAVIKFMPLAYMMERTHRVWLPMITSGQTTDDKFDIDVQRANLAILRKRYKLWKEKYGE